MLRKTMIRATSILGLALSLGIFAAPSFAQAPAGVTLDKANMQPFFANMGYDVQRINDTDYSFKTHTGNFDVTISAALSSNGQVLWLNTFLTALPDSGPLPADVLEATLKANDNIGAASYFIHVCSDCAAGSKRQLRMTMALANQGLTPAIVHQGIESFTQSINNTAQVWSAAAWNPTTAKR